jgi:hypothetical protein
MALMKMGTMIPPPVHAMIMLINLYEKGTFSPGIVLNTLHPRIFVVYNESCQNLYRSAVTVSNDRSTDVLRTVQVGVSKHDHVFLQRNGHHKEGVRRKAATYRSSQDSSTMALTISLVCIRTNSANPFSNIHAVGSWILTGSGIFRAMVTSLVW